MSQTEGRHAAEFLLSEGNGEISREKGVLGGSEVSFEPGQVVALDGTDLVKYDGGSADAVGVLLFGGESGDTVAYIARKAEVKASALVFDASSELTADDIADALASLGIIVR